jgi:hypothetical protein
VVDEHRCVDGSTHRRRALVRGPHGFEHTSGQSPCGSQWPTTPMRKRVTAATYSVTHRDGSILRARALVGVDGRIKALQNCDEAWCVESDFEWRQCDKVSENKVKEIRLELSRRLRFTAVRARALVGVVGQ